MMKAHERSRTETGTKPFGRNGFTLVEMLVVIGILGILSVALLSSYNHVRNSARKAQAQTLVSDATVAFTRYLQEKRTWPPEFLGKDSLGMDEDVCRLLQAGKFLDLTTYKNTESGEINKFSVDRLGLLDPWAQRALKRAPLSTTAATDAGLGNGRTFANHRLQFRLDLNLDGRVDSSEGAPQGVEVRASVLVWSRGPDGLDDFNADGRYPRDDSLSWPHAQYKAQK